MGKVTVYRVQLYDPSADAPMTSRRWMTRRGAEIVNGVIFEDTAVEIDETELENGNQWTTIGFDPNRMKGFQTRVKW